MRIGIMLRTLDEKGGIGVYTRFLTEELIELDRKNTYFLYYRNPEHLGRYVRYPNVTERVITGKNKLIWDQVSIPIACLRDRIDVVFHPKFTVPLLAPCKTSMVLHGAGWFIPEFAKFWKPLDLKYIRMTMPLYCRRADVILSVSQLTTDIFNREFNLPPGKVHTVYLAPGKQFRRITDPAILDAVKTRYNLPDRFIFTLSKYPGGDRKNIDGILAAYARIHDAVEHKLVVGGKDCDRFREIYAIPEDGYGRDVLFPGYMAQEDLPAVYSLADLFLYPSNMEAFPIPVTEAMACGTPIVTSNSNGLKEIAGDAALTVDVGSTEAISAAVLRVLNQPELRETLAHRGLEKSEQYKWDRSARETLQILESLQN